MNAGTIVLVIVALFVLLVVREPFWVIVGFIVLGLYFVSLTTKTAGKGIRKTHAKAKKIYDEETKQLEAFSGKYPAKFFDSVGKAAMEKVNEAQAPKGAKSYKDAQNYVWGIKPAQQRISDALVKFWDGMGKLFGK